MWSLDPQSKVWTEIEISGMSPPGQKNPWYDWGGAGSTLYLSTFESGFWAFSTTTSTWAQLAAVPQDYPTTEGLRPSGGLIYLLSWGDFWSYNPVDNVWTERTYPVFVDGSYHEGVLLDVAGELLIVHSTDTGIASMLPRAPRTTVDQSGQLLYQDDDLTGQGQCQKSIEFVNRCGTLMMPCCWHHPAFPIDWFTRSCT